MGIDGTLDSETLWGRGSSQVGALWLEWMQSPGGRGQQRGMKQNDRCRWQGHWPEGKHWG